MELPSSAVVDVLTYLLPGFITAAILYNLTPAPRPIPFERVVQALIFTIIVQVLVVALRTALLSIGNHGVVMGVWSEDAQLVMSVCLAILLGVAAAYYANTDKLHSVLRKVGLTQQTSYSSEWYGALCQNRGFIVLHLTGQRRLYGWAEEWPSTPDRGHFVISRAQWLDDAGAIELINVQKILIRAADVEMVELMDLLVQNHSEAPDGRS